MLSWFPPLSKPPHCSNCTNILRLSWFLGRLVCFQTSPCLMKNNFWSIELIIIKSDSIPSIPYISHHQDHIFYIFNFQINTQFFPQFPNIKKSTWLYIMSLSLLFEIIFVKPNYNFFLITTLHKEDHVGRNMQFCVWISML